MSSLLPRDDEIRVWRLSLALPPHELARCWRVLAEAERQRVQRLQRPCHRRRAVAARGQLRWLLARGLGVSPRALRFATALGGKPYLPDHDLHFNLSHSGDRLLVAVARNRPVGVDVEQVRSLSRMTALAGQCLAPPELQQWRNLAGEDRVRAFFKFWTGKEAFMKADGRGLSLGMRRCVLALDPLRLLAVPEDCGRPQDWHMIEIDAGGGVQAALCVHGAPVSAVQVTELALDWFVPLRQRPVRAS